MKACISFFLCTTLSFVACAKSRVEVHDNPPNIVLIYIDDLSYKDLELDGYELAGITSHYPLRGGKGTFGLKQSVLLI